MNTIDREDPRRPSDGLAAVGDDTVEHNVADLNASRPEFPSQGLRQPRRAELGAGKSDSRRRTDDVAPVKSIDAPVRPGASISADWP
jgi:hypothetical protein